MSESGGKFYISTPIYYVNDRPHIGHVYTTTIADIVARFHRLKGNRVFYLTGTDEHAAKVVDAASERGLSPQAWANENAQAFQESFHHFGMTHDDFIRTTQNRHKTRVTRYVKELLDSGDVYRGEYEGWYDAGQEEYITENKAKEYGYKSPINGHPLVLKKEKNYFFRLSRYSNALLAWLGDNPHAVQPEARRNEVMGRIREGLNDVPISRTGTGGWGIDIPGDSDQTIYVWIDALFNYLTAVDTEQRRDWWPPDIHFIGKDILWFHAVIWPAVLMALHRRPGYEWVRVPRCVYAHSFWISEGRKMSKSLGNFIDLQKLENYVDTFSLDALRYFLATQGPMHSDDANFAEGRFIDVYNADLANTLGNCLNRIVNMCDRYFHGVLPERGPQVEASRPYAHAAEKCVENVIQAFESLHLDQAAAAAMNLVRSIDGYIEKTQPFKLAQDTANLPTVGTILYHCAEAMRIAALCLWPILPSKCQEIWRRLGCEEHSQALADRGRGDLEAWATWGRSKPGASIHHDEPLFPRYRKGQATAPSCP